MYICGLRWHYPWCWVDPGPSAGAGDVHVLPGAAGHRAECAAARGARALRVSCALRPVAAPLLPDIS